MSIVTKSDALFVLSDPTLRRLYFKVGPIIVADGQYAAVSDCIENDEIKLGIYMGDPRGRDDICSYQADSNIMRFNKGWSRNNLDDRASMIHELTHAFVDLRKIEVRELFNEVAAYLAQLTYVLCNTPNIPDYATELTADPVVNMYQEALDTARKYRLNESQGYGAAITGEDINQLAQLINLCPKYTDIRPDQMAQSDGVPTDRMEVPHIDLSPYQ